MKYIAALIAIIFLARALMACRKFKHETQKNKNKQYLACFASKSILKKALGGVNLKIDLKSERAGSPRFPDFIRKGGDML